MKKKLYTKQRKISNPHEASTDSSFREAEEQNESKTNPSAKRQISEAPTPSPGHNHLYTDTHSSITPSPSVASTSSLSPNSTASSTVGVTTLTRNVSNAGPLPKVDVLMKASLRAFQIADNRNNNAVVDIHPHAMQKGESLGSERHVADNDGGWGKLSEVASNPDLTHSSSNSHYDLEYARPAGFEIRETPGDAMMKRESREPSPVYHQMERPMQPLPDPGMYPALSTMTPGYHELQGQVNGVQSAVANGQGQGMQDSSDVLRNHEMGPYSQEDSDPQNGDNLPTYGHIRAWEQENARYVDYTWRREEHPDDSIYQESDSEDEDEDFVVNTDVLGKRSKRNSGRLGGFGKMSGTGTSSRRRRKRVQTPVQRSAANMRERRRMCHLNVAFDHLKEHLPQVKDKKKLSRIQTLKAAIYYIHLLQDSLNTDPRVSEF